MPEHPLRQILRRHYDRLRRALIARHAVRAAALSTALLMLAVAVGLVLPVVPATAWARALAAAAGAVAAIALALLALKRERPGFDRYLERVEEHFPAVRSWLRNALDLEARPSAHTSGELAEALARETARRLDEVPLDQLRPPIRPRVPLLAIAAALLVLAALAAVAPGRLARSWATLWSPGAAAPEVRLVVEPGSVRLTPGAALAVRARVWGTRERPRLLRDGEASPEASSEGGAGGERRWRFDLTQLTREQGYRVRVAGVESPLYHIGLAGEPDVIERALDPGDPHPVALLAGELGEVEAPAPLAARAAFAAGLGRGLAIAQQARALAGAPDPRAHRERGAGREAHRARLDHQTHLGGGGAGAPQGRPRAREASGGDGGQRGEHQQRRGDREQRDARTDRRTQLVERHLVQAARGLARQRLGQLPRGVGGGPGLEVERVPEPRTHRREVFLDALEVTIEARALALEREQRERDRGDGSRGGGQRPRPGGGRHHRQHQAHRDREHEQGGRERGGAHGVARDQRAAQAVVVAAEDLAQRVFGHGGRPRIARP